MAFSSFFWRRLSVGLLPILVGLLPNLPPCFGIVVRVWCIPLMFGSGFKYFLSSSDIATGGSDSSWNLSSLWGVCMSLRPGPFRFRYFLVGLLALGRVLLGVSSLQSVVLFPNFLVCSRFDVYTDQCFWCVVAIPLWPGPSNFIVCSGFDVYTNRCFGVWLLYRSYLVHPVSRVSFRFVSLGVFLS